MSPIRYRFNHKTMPLYLVALTVLLAAMIVVGETVTPDLWILLPTGAAVAVIVCMLIHGLAVAKKEEKLEIERWAYLFKTDIVYEPETLETDDPETGLQYLLNAKGIKVILPICGEQVFDEAVENEYFLPWDDVEIALATDNFARRVRIALAVVDVSKRSVDGEYVPEDHEVHFLPMEEELIGFVRKYGLEEKISVEWRYILAQPQDAFRQILAWGYIKTLRGKDGKRIKRANAEELY